MRLVACNMEVWIGVESTFSLTYTLSTLYDH